MINTSGLSGAAPIWSQFMQYAVPYVTNNNPTSFKIPPGIIEKIVCNTSGTEPSNWCRGGQRSEFYASDQPPLPPSKDLLTQTTIDTWTGLIAGNACEEFAKKDLVMNVTDEWARKWLKTGDGRNWLEAHDLPRNPTYAPNRECSSSDPRPVIEFSNLDNGSVITGTTLPVGGVIDVKNGDFTSWRLEYGIGDDPSNWTLLAEGKNAFKNPSLIYTWNLQDFKENKVTLRIYLSNGEDRHAEKRVTLTFNLPTPTPEPTFTVTPFPPTDIPTDTPMPATSTSLPTVTPFPSATLTSTETATPTPTFTLPP